MRDSVLFYRSFRQSIGRLNLTDQAELYNAIIDYALDDIIPNLSGYQMSIFELISPQIDANNKKFTDGCKGGRPPSNNHPITTPKPPHNQSKTKAQPNANVNDNDNANENDNVNGGGVVKIINLKTYGLDQCHSKSAVKVLIRGLQNIKYKDELIEKIGFVSDKDLYNDKFNFLQECDHLIQQYIDKPEEVPEWAKGI